MYRQEDRSRTENRRHALLRVESASFLLGPLSPLFNRRSDAFAAFSKSIDSQLATLEQRWGQEPVAGNGFIVFLPESQVPAKPKPR